MWVKDGIALSPSARIGIQLSGKELATLAQRMVDSNDPAEVESLQSEITRGFYGE